MRVELLAVGTELLLGDIVNTNAAWLGQRLAESGFDVTTSVVVGDNIGRIAETLRAGLARADAVVITGGLGPTQDDLTREGIALVAGVGLVRDPDLAEGLRRRYADLGRTPAQMNFRQADLPVGATSLPNTKGSAPGVRMEVPAPGAAGGTGVVYAMPGVPFEMEAMFHASVLSDLLARAGEPAVIVSRVIRTAGIWESSVAEALADEVSRLEELGNPTIAFLAGGGQVRVRITAKATSRESALALVAPVEERARGLLGDAVYGADDDTLPGVVHALLREQGGSVAVAESLTGGLLGATLTDVPGASATFRGGIVAYATDLKSGALDVPSQLLADRGAVSRDVAAAMAAGVRRRLGATHGLATTGVAGPDEQEGQPVGTLHVGLSTPSGGVVRSLRVPGDRARVRQLAVVHALDLLRRSLAGLPAGDLTD
jgi:nicotinamide-nucleotide amidase